jgi:hypothetical protein
LRRVIAHKHLRATKNPVGAASAGTSSMVRFLYQIDPDSHLSPLDKYGPDD